MKLEIRHETHYQFDAPVKLQPHFFRMHPLGCHGLTVSDFAMSVLPEPQGQAWILDEAGNQVLHCWFIGECRSLSIRTSALLDLQPLHPLNFVYHPLVAANADYFANASWPASLQAYLLREDLPAEAQALLESLLLQETSTSGFLLALTRHICQEFGFITRELGPAWPAATTWQQAQGSCRDLAWLMIQLLRAANIPARFVSGYHYAPDLDDHELHAWVEAFLPGGGWVGADPSTGLVVDERYIPVARSFEPGNTLPVIGSYAGTAKSTLEASVLFRER